MNYYLHYIASGKNGIYGKAVFIKEAKQIGVNRSLPYFLIKKLKFGDRILLANFESCHKGEKTYIECNRCDGAGRYQHSTMNMIECEECNGTGQEEVSEKFQDGVAHVFGYFVISGLNIIASDKLKEKLYSQLDIVSSNDKPLFFKRSCGSYVVSSSYIVTNTLEDIINKAQELSKEFNEKIKYFIGGSFYELKSITHIEPINFTRSLIAIALDGIEQIESISKQVGFIKDYNKKGYVPIKERIK